MPGAARLWIRRLAPWVITAAVVAAILREYSLERIASELGDADTLAMLPFAFLLPIAHIAIQPIWDRWVINGGIPARLSYFDVLRGRAGSAVLLALGFAFSSGGYGVWIARKTGGDARTTLGVVAYIMLSGLTAICVLTTAAVWIGRADLADTSGKLGVRADILGIAAPIASVLFCAITIAGPRTLRGMNDPKFLGPWRRISPGLFLANLLGRCADIALIILLSWLGARAFGLEIPLGAFYSYFPLIILIGSLPINIAGFGAVQAAWLVFEPWAPGEQILAFQFVWHLAVAVTIILRGLPFLRGVIREVDRGARPSPEVSE